jgi:hypothetical protein
MKIEPSNDDPDTLAELLRSWKVEASLPPRFQEQVWRDIARAEEKPAWSISAWLLRIEALGIDLLRKPVGAAVYVSMLLAIGILAGVWRSDHYASQTETAWRKAYLQAVTPTLSLPSQP